MSQNGFAVCFKEVYKSFEDNHVLTGLNLEVRWGGVTTILGPSGCGKSVTLKHIIGILRAERGMLEVAGKDMNSISAPELMELRKRIGVLFQSSALFDSMSVKENVAFGLRMHTHKDESEIDARVAECLKAVNLPDSQQLMPEDLSGGMKKRAALARAIAMEPAIILYDEPTTGLDPKTVNVVGDLILKLQHDLEITSIVVTHDLSLAKRLSDSIALLYEGKAVAQGSPEELDCSENEIYDLFVSGQI